MKILRTLRRLVTPDEVKPDPRFHVLSRPEPAPRRDANLDAAMVALHALGTDRGRALADEIQRGEDRRRARS